MIDYKDVRLVSEFVAERGKILPRRLTGTCSTHQRALWKPSSAPGISPCCRLQQERKDRDTGHGKRGTVTLGMPTVPDYPRIPMSPYPVYRSFAMEVILLENIDKLGNRGQMVKVADGYGRNFLLPKKLAVAATAQNRKWVEQQRVRFLKLEAKEKADAADLSTLLEGVSVTLIRKAGEKGNLFGSVTSMDVAEKLLAQGYHIDRRKINLATPIKVLGEYNVPSSSTAR